jgi:hypothetical protein
VSVTLVSPPPAAAGADPSAGPEPVVHVVDAEGNPFSVPASQLARAQAAGMRVASPEDEARAAAQEKYGDAGGQAKALLAGLARGGTAHLSDPLLVGSGLVDADTLKGLDQANPLASGAGELGGLGLATLATGGGAAEAEGAQAAGLAGKAAAGEGAGLGLLAKLGRAVTAPARTISELGGAAAEGAAGVAGEGLAGRLLSGAARGATEGALYQAGQNLTEDVFEHKDLTGESLLAHMGPAAILGGVVGAPAEALLGIAEQRLPKALGKASEALDGMAEKLEQAGPTAKAARFGESLGKVRETGDQVAAAAAEVRDQVVAHALQGSQGAAQHVSPLVAGVRTALEGVEEGGPAVRAATKAVGKLESRLARAADDAERFRLIQETAEKVARGVPRTAETALRADGADAARQASQVLRSILEHEELWGRAAQVQREFGQRFTALAEDASAYGGKGLRRAAGADELAAVRGEGADATRVLKEEGAGGAAEPKKGTLDSFARQLQELADYARGQAEAVLPEGKARIGATAQQLGAALGEMQTARAAGAKAFAASPLEHLEHFLPHGLRGPLSAVAHLDRNAEVIAHAAKAAAAVTQRISAGVEAALAGRAGAIAGLAAAATPTAKKRREAFLEDQKRLGDLANTPDAPMANAQGHTPQLGRAAPGVALVVHTTALRAQQYLAQAMPKNPAPPSPFPGGPEWHPSDAELARYERVRAVVERPLSTLDELRRGSLSSDQVAALQAVYPQLYDRMRSEVLDQVASRKQPIPYQARLQLSVFLGQPLDPSEQMLPALQAAAASSGKAAPPGGQGPGRPTVSGLKQLDVASRNATPSTSTSSRSKP